MNVTQLSGADWPQPETSAAEVQQKPTADSKLNADSPADATNNRGLIQVVLDFDGDLNCYGLIVLCCRPESPGQYFFQSLLIQTHTNRASYTWVTDPSVGTNNRS